MTGYKKMISDRIPRTWDIALRTAKVRQKWIDKVYAQNCAIYNNDCMHSKKQKDALKRANINRIFKNSFVNSIDIDKIWHSEPEEEYYFWKMIIDWGKWFCKTMPYIEASTNIRIKSLGVSPKDCAEQLAKQYKTDAKLMIYILKRLDLWE